VKSENVRRENVRRETCLPSEALAKEGNVRKRRKAEEVGESSVLLNTEN
jgi:hypothetical protein